MLNFPPLVGDGGGLLDIGASLSEAVEIERTQPMAIDDRPQDMEPRFGLFLILRMI